MTLTPIVADTATASATMATPVRLRFAPMPETASLAGVPPSFAANGSMIEVIALTARGTHRANPSMSMKTAASPATRSLPDPYKSRMARMPMLIPAMAIKGRSLPVRRSRTERVIASRG